MKKLLDSIRLTVWTAEFAWRAASFLIVAVGGTTAGMLAAGVQVFQSLGPLAWLSVGLLAALATALILFLVRAAQRAAAEASVSTAIAARPAHINPLHPNFSDVVIRLADLHLPGKQVHENKQFRRCKFAGPGAIVLMGGTFVRSNFHDIGHILTVPDNTTITGITVLLNCTVEDCDFYRTTIIASRAEARNLSRIPGVQVAL